MIVYVELDAKNADHSLCFETIALLTRLHHVVQKYYRIYLLKQSILTTT